MVMESRSEKISNTASLWLQNYHPTLITIKGGVTYYEDPENPYGPFMCIKGDSLYRTTFYGLDDVELFG